MKKKYGALRTIGTVYKIIGAVIAVFTILGTIGTCILGFAGGALFQGAANSFGTDTGMGTTGLGIAGVLAAIWILVVGAIASVTTFAMGEGVFLLLDLEENTRKTSELLEKQ
jgi:hypothetical protein